MVEVEPIDNNQIKLEKKEENKFLLTDEYIIKANDLFRRKDSTENPLTKNEQAQLEEAEAIRKREINSIIPDFSFEFIPVSAEQYELAINYFNKVQMFNNSGALYNQNLYLEKLRNWDKNPESIRNSFETISENKKKGDHNLIEEIKLYRNSNVTFKKEDWQKITNGSATESEMKKYEDKIHILQLKIKNIIPDHLIEAVRYDPSLIGDVLLSVRSYRGETASKQNSIKNNIENYRATIKRFEELVKPNSGPSFVNHSLPNTSPTQASGRYR